MLANQDNGPFESIADRTAAKWTRLANPALSIPVPPGGRPSRGADADLTGQTLGDYKILRRIGQGGMGQVFLAEQISLKRKVALKLLKPELANNTTSLARFKAEAEAVAKATHANIVQVYAIHEIGGIHLMVLEFVEGRNLREFLEKKGPPEVLLGLSIMRQVAAALQRASELGIVHRDIKPENILLTRKGEVKVADFGLSRVYAEDGEQPLHLTQSGVTMGTPLYMSPEQVEGKKTIDHRTDIYSFGVTCYQMFAGHPPFRGTAPFEVAVQHVQSEPKPLAEIRPDLPAELCAIIHKMMAKAPEDRYQLGREIVRDIAKLRDVLVGSGQTLAQPASPLFTAPSKILEAATTMPMERRRLSPWPRRLLIASLPLALISGLLIGVARNYDSAPPETVIVPAPVALPPVTRPAVSPRDREKMLLSELQELSKKTQDPLTTVVSLNFSLELGLLYLSDQERLGDAEKLFSELKTKQNANFKLMGRLGTAMVFAFKDQPEKSNGIFLAILSPEKAAKEKLNPFWKSNAAWREMMAKALNFNLQNNPATFPDKLRPYLHPPAPTLRSQKKEDVAEK